jgi:hypothetical protein
VELDLPDLEMLLNAITHLNLLDDEASMYKWGLDGISHAFLVDIFFVGVSMEAKYIGFKECQGACIFHSNLNPLSH